MLVHTGTQSTRLLVTSMRKQNPLVPGWHRWNRPSDNILHGGRVWSVSNMNAAALLGKPIKYGGGATGGSRSRKVSTTASISSLSAPYNDNTTIRAQSRPA